MYCNNCGKENPERSNFCQFCGIKIRSTLQLHEIEEEKSTTRWSLFWKVPLGMIAFCIVACVMLFVFSSKFRADFWTEYNYATTSIANASPLNTSSLKLNSWISFTPDTEQFTVALPSSPLHKSEKANDGNYYDEYTTSTDNETTGYFINEYEMEPTDDVDSLLETAADDMVKGAGNGAKITYRKYTNVGSNRAMDYVITYDTTTMAGRLIFDSRHNILFMLLDAYYTSSPDMPGLKKFVNSFQIID